VGAACASHVNQPDERIEHQTQIDGGGGERGDGGDSGGAVSRPGSLECFSEGDYVCKDGTVSIVTAFCEPSRVYQCEHGCKTDRVLGYIAFGDGSTDFQPATMCRESQPDAGGDATTGDATPDGDASDGRP
jgi:hypothetical protein